MDRLFTLSVTHLRRLRHGFPLLVFADVAYNEIDTFRGSEFPPFLTVYSVVDNAFDTLLSDAGEALE